MKTTLYQPTVAGTNSTPIGISNLGYGEEGNFIQCKQLNYDITWLWNSMTVRQPCSNGALPCPSLLHLCLLCSGLIHMLCFALPGGRLPCFSSRRGNAVFSGREHTLLSQRKADLYREKSLLLVLDLFVLMQMSTPNPHSLIGSKSTVFIG